MCCRYLLLQEHLRAVLEKMGIETPADFRTRYNLPPGGAVPAVRVAPGRGRREAVSLHWGFVPAWAKERADFGTKLINARAESLAEKPAFRDAFRLRRCALPASGFYEWESGGYAPKPWLFRWRDEQPFFLAGLWESWRASDGDVLESCAVITTEPNELMRPIHHRMPAMLTPEQCDRWLDPAEQAPARLAPLLAPPPAGRMTAFRVSPRVNHVAHDDERCVAPAAASAPDATGDDAQLSLGL
jgi:putative SOS response-associated peptidase YedK